MLHHYNIFLVNPERPNIASYVLTIFSFLFVMSTLPLSLIFCVKVGNISYLASLIYSSLLKVVQEYERAVIFRLGRLRRGGAKVF